MKTTTTLAEALREQGVGDTYIALLEHLYDGCRGMIIFHKKSEKFSIRKGVRIGYQISRKVFRACLEGVFWKLDWEKPGIRVNEEYLSHLRFADEIVLLSESIQDLEKCFMNCTQKAQS